MKTSETLGKISPALVKAQKSMGAAKKDADNPFFKSKYADLNAIREAVLPSLNENGISVLQLTVEKNEKHYVLTTLLHESGEAITSETQIVTKPVYNAQEMGSAISYARRYGLQAMLCVGAEDDDGESAVSRTEVVKKGAAKKAPSKGEDWE